METGPLNGFRVCEKSDPKGEALLLPAPKGETAVGTDRGLEGVAVGLGVEVEAEVVGSIALLTVAPLFALKGEKVTLAAAGAEGTAGADGVEADVALAVLEIHGRKGGGEVRWRGYGTRGDRGGMGRVPEAQGMVEEQELTYRSRVAVVAASDSANVSVSSSSVFWVTERSMAVWMTFLSRPMRRFTWAAPSSHWAPSGVPPAINWS